MKFLLKNVNVFYSIPYVLFFCCFYLLNTFINESFFFFGYQTLFLIYIFFSLISFFFKSRILGYIYIILQMLLFSFLFSILFMNYYTVSLVLELSTRMLEEAELTTFSLTNLSYSVHNKIEFPGLFLNEGSNFVYKAGIFYCSFTTDFVQDFISYYALSEHQLYPYFFNFFFQSIFENKILKIVVL
jgi:hypothetical protein